MQHSQLAQAGLAKLPDVFTDGYRGVSLAGTQFGSASDHDKPAAGLTVVKTGLGAWNQVVRPV